MPSIFFRYLLRYDLPLNNLSPISIDLKMVKNRPRALALKGRMADKLRFGFEGRKRNQISFPRNEMMFQTLKDFPTNKCEMQCR